MTEVVEGRLAVGDTGEFLDTTKVIHQDGTLNHREGVFIGDPKDAGLRADVGESGGVVGLTVREADFGRLLNQMETLVSVQKRMLCLLEEAFDDNLSSSNGKGEL